ncbi:hypothetical protein Cyrtocomes_00665 [Candidatus Cyrtobacter comes]|uniref:Uncharacterized protein n=2 Tax=Candidatus Cyrtobacter comes TaxID=675776 RepID=A0ABU5L831_9RICK|nr:hypothetical protein [Candidatus Cyrtobacter comes]
MNSPIENNDNQEQAMLFDPYRSTFTLIDKERLKKETKAIDLSIVDLNKIDNAGAYFIVFVKKAKEGHKFHNSEVSKTSACSFIHLGFDESTH